MRKTDISQYSKSTGNSAASRAKGPRNNFSRISVSVLKILWRFFLSIFAIIFLTGIIILISLNFYKSALLKNDIALNINASKVSLTSFVYANDENGNPQEYLSKFWGSLRYLYGYLCIHFSMIS